MTREMFYDKMVESDGGNSPPETKEINVDKIVDTITMKLENKLKNEIQKITEQNEKILKEKENYEDNKNKQGVNKERVIQSNNESANDTN